MTESLERWNKIILFLSKTPWYKITPFVIIYLGLMYFWITKIVLESWRNNLEEIINSINENLYDNIDALTLAKAKLILEWQKNIESLNPIDVINLYRRITPLEKIDKNQRKGKFSKETAFSMKLAIIYNC